MFPLGDRAKYPVPLSKDWIYMGKKVTHGKEKIVTFQWRNLADGTLTTWGEANISSDVMWESFTPKMMWRALPSVVFLPKTFSSNAVMRKTSDESKPRGLLQYNAVYSKPSSSWKGEKVHEKQSMDHRGQGEMTTECKVVFWIGSCNRKRTLVD